MTAKSVWNFVCYSTWARAPGTAFWLVHNWPLGLRGIYITLGYTFFSSIENFSAYCPVLRGSILLPPRHPSVFARMARWQLLTAYVKRTDNKTPLTMNLTLKIAHETKKTNKLYYTRDDPDKLANCHVWKFCQDLLFSWFDSSIKSYF